jgi:hypothetical protein
LKIKTDFVTNSSSTAFIVIWPTIVESIEDVTKFISNKHHARIIFNDIKDQPITKVDLHDKELLNEIWSKMSNGYVDDVSVDYFKYKEYFMNLHVITEKELDSNLQWRKKFLESHSNENKKKSTQAAIEFLEPHGGKYVYFFTYSDEDGGLFTELEHENDWGGLPHIRASNH